jgi:hypothetical protein
VVVGRDDQGARFRDVLLPHEFDAAVEETDEKAHETAHHPVAHRISNLSLTEACLKPDGFPRELIGGQCLGLLARVSPL